MLRIVRAARLAAPLENQIDRDVTVPTISVIIPARNEASRIRACLEAIVGASGVHEVIVVDDESSDETADIASRLGATVLNGKPLPDGWVGKAWALHQGFRLQLVNGWSLSTQMQLHIHYWRKQWCNAHGVTA